jgi:hypothetical protein
LTLNLGLRYNLCTFPLEVHNYQSNFNLSTLTLQQAGTHGLAQGTRPLSNFGAMVHRSDPINSGPQ